MTYTTKIFIILLLTGIGVAAAAFSPSFAQDPAYHNFIDKRSMYDITNFWNVASNLSFVLFGLLGLYKTSRSLPYGQLKKLQFAYTLFFTGAILVGLGSAYYHLDPNSETLFWDRLPIAITIMAFFSIIIAEYISIEIGKILLIPLLAAGTWSVIYWFQTEQSGSGDLRPYVVVQFLPFILVPAILLLMKNGTPPGTYIWALLLFFLLSKAAEYFDVYLFEQLKDISGHSIKHFLASLGVFFFYLHFNKRLNAQGE